MAAHQHIHVHEEQPGQESLLTAAGCKKLIICKKDKSIILISLCSIDFLLFLFHPLTPVMISFYSKSFELLLNESGQGWRQSAYHNAHHLLTP